jgi:MFS transporter, DHA1 family, inner membrane transport protein
MNETRPALWVFLLGNFIIGTGILLPAGLLNALTAEYKIAPSSAGLLMLVGGIVVAIGAPLFAGMTSSINRRTLLTGALTLYGAGHILSALTPSFDVLLVLRAATAAGAAIFTPQAAATVGLLVPPEKRAAGIAFVFIGWSAASVAGIPMGSYLASVMGWRYVFAGVGLLCLVVAAMLAFSLRKDLYVTPLNASAWKQALTTPVILVMLLVTLLSMSGQMTVFTYMAPILRDAYEAEPYQISLVFAAAGIAGVIGNALASLVVERLGIDRVIAFAITAIVLGLAVFALGFGSLPIAIAGATGWGLGSFSSNSLQQSRLASIAPALAAATISLNTSVVYVGQAVGAIAGGWFMSGEVTQAIAWTAAGFALAALCVSLLAQRMKRST